MVQLQLETSGYCNGKCIFCVYPKSKSWRPRGMMLQSLFEKIINEARHIDVISEISFQGLGEPLLDANIVKRVAFAKKVRRRWHTTLFTNGSYLTVDTGRALEKAGLGALYVSINGESRERRRAVMGLDDFDEVVRVTKELMNRCTTMRVVPKAVVGMGYFAGEAVDQLRAEFRGFGREPLFAHLEGNWAGVLWPTKIPQTEICSRALSQIMVLWDGRVALCCFDGLGECILGDLNAQTLKEVYSNPEYVAIRQAHAEGGRASLKMCGRCTAI